MIASLRGEVSLKAVENLIVDVGGVGYEVYVSKAHYERLPEVGQEIFLHIYTDVREDALTLYGFCEPGEKRMFLLLLSVSGVGPKLALNILSGLPAAELAQAICADNLARLTGIAGVGKKTAERLCLELKDKVQFMPEHYQPSPAQESAPATTEQLTEDVISALVNLGYPAGQAREALEKVRRQTEPEAYHTLRLEELIRLALRSLA